MNDAGAALPGRPLPWFRRHLWVDAPLMGAHVSLAATGSWAALAGLSVGIVGLHAWASMHPHASWYLRSHWRLPRDATSCALTFDDGPHPEYTPRILDLLAQHGQRATFFVIGVHAAAHGALMRRMLAEGHRIGLHSHRHTRWFNVLPRHRVRADLSACADAIADATGAPPPRLVRPPVGLRSPQVADAFDQLGLICVTWTQRIWDTRKPESERIAEHLLRAAQPGSIILGHDGHEPGRVGDRSATVAALASALPNLPCASAALMVTADGTGVTTVSSDAHANLP